MIENLSIFAQVFFYIIPLDLFMNIYKNRHDYMKPVKQ